LGFTPYSIVGAIKPATSCIMLELDQPLERGKKYTLGVYIKPLCAYRSYPPHPNFGIKISETSIAETPYTRIFGNGWRPALDSVPGTVHYFNPKALRCEANGPFMCPDWEAHEFVITATGGERYIYLSIFGNIPSVNLWDLEKRIKKLVHQYDSSHNARRSSKAMAELRTIFPWSSDEVPNVELAFFASTWRYQAVADATYLIDDVSIRIKE